MSRRLPSPSLGLRAVGRQLFSQPAVVVSVAVIVFGAAFALTVLPRSLELASRHDLHETLTTAHPALRNIAVSQEFRHRSGPEGDRLSIARDRGERFAAREMSPSLIDVVESRDMLVESPQFSLVPVPGTPAVERDPVFLRFRHQDSIADVVEVTEGRLPAPAGEIEVQFECPPTPAEPEDESETPEECPPTPVQVFEVALTEAMSQATRLDVGDQVLLVPDPQDRLWTGLAFEERDQIRVAIEVSGVVELPDSDLDIWYGDRNLHIPRIVLQDDLRFVYGTALMSPDDYARLLRSITDRGPPWWRYEWRFFIDTDAVTRSDLDEFRGDVARLRLAHSSAPTGSGGVLVTTRLPELIDSHLAQRSQTLRVMALSIAGILATVTFAVLALGVLMTERQRAQLVLARDRGASAPQVTTSRLYQAALMTAPPAAAAYAAVSAVFPDTDKTTPYLVTLVLTGAVLAVLVASVVGLARLPLGALREHESWRRPHNPRRAVVEVLVIVVAMASVLLVRRRDPRATTELDWLLVATPALVGAAVGAITIRLAGPVASALSWLSSPFRGAVAFLGLRRVIQQPITARIPLAVIVVCMATASFSVVIQQSVVEGQINGSWLSVGADYAVSSPGLDTPLSDAVGSETLGVEEIVYATTYSNARATLFNQPVSVMLVALDSQRHEDVFGGTPGDLTLTALRTPPSESALTGIASVVWPTGSGPRVGQTVRVQLRGNDVDVEIVGVRSRHPGVDAVRPFIVVDRGELESVTGPSRPTLALIRGPRSLGPMLTERLGDTGADVVSRYAELDRLAADPLVRWSVQGMTAAWLMAAAVGILSMVASLALGSARRRRDFGYLKTLGLDDRAATALTLIEQVPGVALASALGLVTGAATLVAIRPSLDLSVFTGERSTPIGIDWGLLGWVLVAAVALLAAAGVIFVLVNRRQELGRALRVGEE